MILLGLISAFVTFPEIAFKVNISIHTLKAIGGGPGPKYDKFSVRCICLANFFYFQTLFTEFKKLSPLVHNWPVCEEG